MATAGEEGFGIKLGFIRRSAGDRSLLRMDRWPEETRKRTGVVTKIRSPIGKKCLVKDQPDKIAVPDRAGQNAGCWSGGD